MKAKKSTEFVAIWELLEYTQGKEMEKNPPGSPVVDNWEPSSNG